METRDIKGKALVFSRREFTPATRVWRLLRVPSPRRGPAYLYRCKSLFAGIYVRAKQVPGSEAPQYDNAITPPPPSPPDFLRCSQSTPSPSSSSSSSPPSILRRKTPSLSLSRFSPRGFPYCDGCRLLLCPAVNITIRKCDRDPFGFFVSPRFFRSSFALRVVPRYLMTRL